jgi:hypothetical protein
MPALPADVSRLRRRSLRRHTRCAGSAQTEAYCRRHRRNDYLGKARRAPRSWGSAAIRSMSASHPSGTCFQSSRSHNSTVPTGPEDDLARPEINRGLVARRQVPNADVCSFADGVRRTRFVVVKSETRPTWWAASSAGTCDCPWLHPSSWDCPRLHRQQTFPLQLFASQLTGTTDSLRPLAGSPLRWFFVVAPDFHLAK